jgi:hypothetical protein
MYKSFNEIIIINLQDIIVVQKYKIVKIQMHFRWNYLIFFIKKKDL